MCPLEHLIRPYNLTEAQNASVDINGQRSHNVVSCPVITALGWGPRERGTKVGAVV